MWKNMRIEIPPNSYIPGEDLESKIEWLNNRIKILENQKVELKAMIKAESECPEIIEKTECLSSSENKILHSELCEIRKKIFKKNWNT